MPLMRRRRPLLRAAAVGGGAYMAGKRHAEGRQAEMTQDARLDQMEQQQSYGAPPPAPAAPTGGLSDNSMAQLQQLGALHEQGVLTDDEFARQKTRLLG